MGRKNTADVAAGYSVTGCITSDGADVVTLIGTTTEDFAQEDSAGWGVVFSADDTNNSLKCAVTGELEANWVAYVQTVQVTFPDVY